MKINSKIVTYYALFLILVVTISNNVFAGERDGRYESLTYDSIIEDESKVTAVEDGIVIKKAVTWSRDTDYIVDNKGRYFMKVDMSVDLRNFSKCSDTQGTSTDIVWVMDVSTSMDERYRLDMAKTEVNKIFEEFLISESNNRRVGIVTFSTACKEILPLDPKKSAVTTGINSIRTEGQTNLQGGIYTAQKMLEESNAENKYMIILTDGDANLSMEDGEGVAQGETPAQRAQNQAQLAKESIQGLNVITIGYDTYTWCDDVLREIASSDDSGNKMFYSANTYNNYSSESLKSALEDIIKKVEAKTYDHMLIDYLPEGITVDNGRIYCDYDGVDITYDGKKIVWSFGQKKLDKTRYRMCFFAKVDLSKLPEGYIENNQYIYSNGTNMDIQCDSSNSLVFSYSESNKRKEIGLKSPMLDLRKKDYGICNDWLTLFYIDEPLEIFESSYVDEDVYKRLYTIDEYIKVKHTDEIPTEPEDEIPSESKDEAPTEPEDEIPEEPKDRTPTEQEAVKPTELKDETLTEPVDVTPAELKDEIPTEPVEANKNILKLVVPQNLENNTVALLDDTNKVMNVADNEIPLSDIVNNKKNIFTNSQLDRTPTTGYDDALMEALCNKKGQSDNVNIDSKSLDYTVIVRILIICTLFSIVLVKGMKYGAENK